ncbi:MAG: hypothetical protein PUP92_30045, partial [Rhizonema sp. PD38]|nr:hypothetical protein [Rhizonema sp. PD38]
MSHIQNVLKIGWLGQGYAFISWQYAIAVLSYISYTRTLFFIPFHENLDTNNGFLILSPCSPAY